MDWSLGLYNLLWMIKLKVIDICPKVVRVYHFRNPHIHFHDSYVHVPQSIQSTGQAKDGQ